MGEQQKDGKLLEEAAKVYGLKPENVFGHRIENTGEVVICTAGGTKIFHRKGQAASRTLTQMEKSGTIAEGETRTWSRRFCQWLKASEI